MPEALIHARGLTRRFGSLAVLDSVDFELGWGERLAILGPNGSGKTTLLRCLAGTLEPSEGELSVAGKPPGSFEASRTVGLSFAQDTAFELALSGRENLVLFGTLRNGSRRAAAKEANALVDELELTFAGALVGTYSAGMRQQLGFARSLLGSPRLLLLDEPTRSLDDAARERLWAAIDRRPEAALVIATHRGDDTARCQRHLDLAH
jgi:ABC-type multidrug transport system ATPase subunit